MSCIVFQYQLKNNINQLFISCPILKGTLFAIQTPTLPLLPPITTALPRNSPQFTSHHPNITRINNKGPKNALSPHPLICSSCAHVLELRDTFGVRRSHFVLISRQNGFATYFIPAVQDISVFPWWSGIFWRLRALCGGCAWRHLAGGGGSVAGGWK